MWAYIGTELAQSAYMKLLLANKMLAVNSVVHHFRYLISKCLSYAHTRSCILQNGSSHLFGSSLYGGKKVQLLSAIIWGSKEVSSSANHVENK